MKSKIVLALCIAVTALQQLPASAQDARELIHQDLRRAGNVHHVYEDPAVIVDSPAPKGYKPFYVSHYGRHGSRYATSERYYDELCPVLDTLYTSGLLTEKGKRVREEINLIAAEHRNISGILTQVGSMEHQRVGDRLYKRYPRIFNQKGRQHVVAQSTHIQRCIQSMANFTLSLKGNQPGLQFNLYTGERYMDVLCHDYTTPREVKDVVNAKLDSIATTVVDGSAFFATMVSDVNAATAMIGAAQAKDLMYDVYYAGCISQCMDGDMPFIFDHFTEEELYSLFKNNTAKVYANYAGSTEDKGGRPRGVGGPILRDIVDRADAALAAGSDVCADLRFGHDTGIAPLLVLIGIEEYRYRPVAEAANNWYAFENLSMCTNLQMIFYKNGKDDVLVKFLFNERETRLTDLEPETGVYYNWKQLRPFFLDRIENFGK